MRLTTAPVIESMFSEFKIAARSLARNPAHTAVVMLTLALGLGTAATFYSLLKQALFPRTPYFEPERLVRIELLNRDVPAPRAPFLLRFHAYREVKSLAALGGAWSELANVEVNGEPEAISVTQVTDNFLPTLGVAPVLGRGFTAEEYQAGKDDAVLLTDWFWRNRLGADPEVLGRSLTVGGHPLRIVGVLPKGFLFPATLPGDRTVVRPYPLPVAIETKDTYLPVVAIGRLAPGAAPAQLKAELDTIRPEKGKPFEKFMSGFEAQVVPVTAPPGHAWARRYNRMLWTSLGAVACLYAIAVVNAGSLVLVRMLGRRREIGIRLALGGGRWQVMRPHLWEAVLLSAGMAVLGGVFAYWLLPAMLEVGPTGLSGTQPDLSFENLMFLAGVGGLTGLAVVLGPVWLTARRNINDVVKDGSMSAGESRASRRLRGSLVVVEATLAVVLLMGAGLMVRTFMGLAAQKPGYETSRRYVLQFTEAMATRPRGEALLARRGQMMERLAAVPGVAEVGLAMASTPGFYFPQKVQIVGRADATQAEAMANPVSPGLAESLGIPLRLGQPMSAQRPWDPPAVWINETMARRYFPGRNPIGERLSVAGNKPWEIRGVVGDQVSRRDGAKPLLYFPYWQAPTWVMSQAVIRVPAEPGPKFAAELRRALYGIDPGIVVQNLRSLDQVRDDEVMSERSAYSILRVVAALALLLAVTGLFAMTAYSVAQRRAEFGVRLALGAPTASLYRLVFASGVGLAAAGVALGLAAAWGLARFLETLLIGIPPHDLPTFSTVGLLMVGAALAACWLPARRAARVDVTRLLRSE